MNHSKSKTKSKLCTISVKYALCLVLGLLTAAKSHGVINDVQHKIYNHLPKYDHDQRNYYLIKVQPPHQQQLEQEHEYGQEQAWQGIEQDQPSWTLNEDHQQILGNLLGLRFESRVGISSKLDSVDPDNNNNYSSSTSTNSKPNQTTNKQSHHYKRALVAPDSIEQAEDRRHHSRSVEQAEANQNGGDSSFSEGPDKFVERFYELKERSKSDSINNNNNGSSNRRQKRHSSISEQDHVIRSMSEIHKQSLRQRVKKRAPLPDSELDMHSRDELSDQEEIKADEEEMDQDEAEVKSAAMEQSTESQKEQKKTEQDADETQDNTEYEQFSEQEGVDKEEEISVAETKEEEGEEEGGEEEEIEEEEEKEEEESEGEGEGEETGKSKEQKEEYQPAGEDQPEDGVAKLLGIVDPGFQYQWHLHNTRERHDINVTGVWEQGINGTGVNVAIIDDGLDMDSEDLAPNFFKEGSWDFNDHTNLPKPRLIDDLHGTRCAGEIASAKNDLCGVGVAYGAKVAGLRILSGQITDVDEAAALNYRFQDNHIYSCSWGPPDDGRSMDAPKGVVKDAMLNGIKNGRSGLGSIYVFATGNGGSQDDDCNFDGYTNSLYTLSIGAIDREQRHPYYSEACSAQLAVTYSNGGGSAIYTCDVGERRCYGQHGGTSAAAPIAAGMVALVLSVRPDLTWRDIQYLVMNTAIPISLEDNDWGKTASGRLFNHKFGYGSLDAYRLVEAAKTFKSLRPQTSLHPATIHVGKPIPQGGKGISSTFKVTKEAIEKKSVRLGSLEHITVTVNIEHQRRGDVEVVLTSPNKIESRLGVRRRYDDAVTGFVDWTFMTVKHWEENPIGDWTLTVRDQSNPNFKGKFIDWRIKFWGEKGEEIVISQPLNEAPMNEQVHESILNEAPVVQSEVKTSLSSEPSLEPSPDNKDNVDPSVNVKIQKGTTSGNEKNSNGGFIGVNKGGSNKDGASKGDIAKDNSVDEQVEWHAQTESEEELASIVSHTLYIFCGVLGIAGLIIGFMVKRKADNRNRGSYIGIRGHSLDMNIHDFDNDGGDDVDL
ncbi:pheromone processing endoprotease [Entomortierella beljakovae]|nr:pheromone processing endoprotease [Entomortierella beljakovae]